MFFEEAFWAFISILYSQIWETEKVLMFKYVTIAHIKNKVGRHKIQLENLAVLHEPIQINTAKYIIEFISVLG